MDYDRVEVLGRVRGTDQWEVISHAVCMATWVSGGRDHLAGEVCGREVFGNVGDIDLCTHHYNRTEAWRDDLADGKLREIELGREELERGYAKWRARYAREEAARTERQRTKDRESREAESLIYYIRRPDGLIKIGTTARVSKRMRTLEREYGEIRLLLTHPGARDAEQKLHSRFSVWRDRGEWFHPGKPLVEHIRWMRYQGGRFRPEVGGTVSRTELAALTKGALQNPPPARYTPPRERGRYQRNRVA